MTDTKAEAIRIVRQALQNLEDPERDTHTEISRLHGLMGLLKKREERDDTENGCDYPGAD